MNKVLIFFVVAAILGFAGYRIHKGWDKHRGLSTPEYDWITFTPANRKFQITIPDEPKYVEDIVAIPNSDKKRGHQIYVAEEMDGSVYMLSIVTYPDDYDMSNKKKILSELVDELLQKHESTVAVTTKEGTMEGRIYEGFAFHDKGLDIHGRAIVGDDNTIYVLTYTDKADNFSIDEYHHFIQSFHILPQEDSKTSQAEKLQQDKDSFKGEL